eukprot:4976052-Pyramimonas_sp.AAC.1
MLGSTLLRGSAPISGNPCFKSTTNRWSGQPMACSISSSTSRFFFGPRTLWTCSGKDASSRAPALAYDRANTAS